jgi:hypothetical protein
MGCSLSTLFNKSKPEADEPPAAPPADSQGLQAFVHKPNFKKPSFQAAYARAVRRYKPGPGKFATYAFRDNQVVKINAASDTTHEVPAESVQNEYARFQFSRFRALINWIALNMLSP